MNKLVPTLGFQFT